MTSSPPGARSPSSTGSTWSELGPLRLGTRGIRKARPLAGAGLPSFGGGGGVVAGGGCVPLMAGGRVVERPFVGHAPPEVGHALREVGRALSGRCAVPLAVAVAGGRGGCVPLMAGGRVVERPFVGHAPPEVGHALGEVRCMRCGTCAVAGARCRWRWLPAGGRGGCVPLMAGGRVVERPFVGHAPPEVGHAPAQGGHAPPEVGHAPAEVGHARAEVGHARQKRDTRRRRRDTRCR